MKKILQKMALILLVCALCVCLGGCGALDKARARHAKRSETGSVLYDGTEYFPVEASEYLDPSIDYLGNPLYLTEQDVPVLLSSFSSELLYVGADGIFLKNYETGALYCRADHYDEVSQKLRDGFETVGYCYEYYEYDEESNYKEHIYRLTDAEAAVLDAVLATGTVITDANIVYDYQATITSCDESMLFRYYMLNVCCINGKYFFTSLTAVGNTWCIWVPEQYNAVFDSMLKVPREQYEKSQSWYEDDYEYEYET